MIFDLQTLMDLVDGFHFQFSVFTYFHENERNGTEQKLLFYHTSNKLNVWYSRVHRNESVLKLKGNIHWKKRKRYKRWNELRNKPVCSSSTRLDSTLVHDDKTRSIFVQWKPIYIQIHRQIDRWQWQWREWERENEISTSYVPMRIK